MAITPKLKPLAKPDPHAQEVRDLRLKSVVAATQPPVEESADPMLALVGLGFLSEVARIGEHVSNIPKSIVAVAETKAIDPRNRVDPRKRFKPR